MSELLRVLVDELAADPVALERFRDLLTPASADAEPWIDVRAAAEHLACKRQRIYNLVNENRIPHHRDGSRLLFRRSELDEWLRRVP